MKLFLISCLVAVVAAAPQSRAEYPQILRYENERFANNGYKFAFDQSDGIRREEQGEIRNYGTEDEYLYVKGFYSYLGDNGVAYNVKYVADNNGFQPEIEEGPGSGVPNHIATLLG